MKLIAQSNRQKLAPSTSQSQSIKFEKFILGGRKRSLFNQRQHCILSAWVIPPRGANRATILESFKLNPLFFALLSASAAAPNNILVLRRCRRLTRRHIYFVRIRFQDDTGFNNQETASSGRNSGWVERPEGRWMFNEDFMDFVAAFNGGLWSFCGVLS